MTVVLCCQARRIALEESRPVFIEAMSYRRGHHSTSDDSTRYRSLSEINEWATLDPMKRFQKYMLSQGWWDEERDRQLLDEERMQVLKALETAETRGPPPISELFNDVYDTPTVNLKRQEKELHAHIAKYPDHYNSPGH
jgi:2-oxoisovalerate dehydrogenase E1 component alpha subunit